MRERTAANIRDRVLLPLCDNPVRTEPASTGKRHARRHRVVL